MAAHEMLAGYGDVMDIATALKVPTTGYQDVLVYDRGSRRYMDMLTATQSGGYGKLQVVWASLRYTWMLLTRFRKFSQPGSGFANAPPELLQPLASWLKQRRLEALQETITVRDEGAGLRPARRDSGSLLRQVPGAAQLALQRAARGRYRPVLAARVQARLPVAVGRGCPGGRRPAQRRDPRHSSRAGCGRQRHRG